MSQNTVVHEIAHKVRTDANEARHDSATSGQMRGHQTVKGAAIMTVAPVAVVAAASFTTAFAFAAVAAVVAFATAKFAGRASSADDPTGGSDPQTETANCSAPPCD